MDQQLELITTWFTKLGIENVDIDKLKRQLSIISTWFAKGCKGVAEAVTGFGKTYLAIIAIYRLNLKYPDATVIVVVPTTKLFNDWTDHIRNFGLKNVSLFVVNTYTQNYVKTKVRYQCTLLIVDEVHRVLSNKGVLFNKTIICTDFKMFLGLTATLENEEREILIHMGIPVVDTVGMSEAKRFKYISDYKIYNLGIRLRPEFQVIYDRFNDIHNSNLGKFQYFVDSEKNWDLIRACTVGKDVRVKVGEDWRTGEQHRTWYANTMGWDGDPEHPWSPKNISKYAQQWDWAMRERKKFLYNSIDKIKACKDIVTKFDVPTITFAETTQFVDDLVLALGDKARAYHSAIKTQITYKKEREERNLKYIKALTQKTGGKWVGFNESTKKHIIEYDKPIKISGARLKQKIINDFEDGKFTVLCTAKALDEGFNVEGIELAIICSATSKQRNAIQRNGRALRFKPNKTAIIVNIYLMDTQDEVWLKRRQKGEAGIEWIESIEEIV